MGIELGFGIGRGSPDYLHSILTTGASITDVVSVIVPGYELGMSFSSPSWGGDRSEATRIYWAPFTVENKNT